MSKPWHTWLLLALFVAFVMTAMGWISLTVLRLDRDEAAASRKAALEENVRLALWRIDSALAPVVAQESARPYFTYTAFYAPDRAYTRMFAQINRGEVLFPSPLLDPASPFVLLHFQIEPDGTFTSPQVPRGNMRDLAETGYTTYEKIEAAAKRLAELQSPNTRQTLLTSLNPPATQPFRIAVLPDQKRERPPDNLRRQSDDNQSLLSENEEQARLWNSANFGGVLTNDGSNVLFSSPSVNVSESLARPVWIDDMLLLARSVSVNGEVYLQGCWLDWPAIRAWLIGNVTDLLPDARLEAVRDRGERIHEGHMLAALPVQLVPGDIPAAANTSMSPNLFSLLIAWICVLLGAFALIALLLGTVALSERRAAFVSAVTHEMRTPLTTFRMYTEMLTGGMVPDESKRQRYLHTLHTEAGRLSHLVENVLAYARLEKNGQTGRPETFDLPGLLDRTAERLADRAKQADMELIVNLPEETSALTVHADKSAVEQVLVNLVDNACKYAATASDRRIHLEADRNGDFAILRVRDNGPGITRRSARKLFRPFCKSDRDAANSAPGVGLGLALSRRLARHMGGDLRLDHNTTTGACFVLTIPANKTN